jgi:hypothetical protein
MHRQFIEKRKRKRREEKREKKYRLVAEMEIGLKEEACVVVGEVAEEDKELLGERSWR